MDTNKVTASSTAAEQALMKGYMWYIHMLVRVNTEQHLRANLDAAFFILSQSTDNNGNGNHNDNDNGNSTQQQKTLLSTREALADHLVLHAFAHHGLAHLLVTAPLDAYTMGYVGLWAAVGVPERLRGEFCRRLHRLLFDLHVIEWPHGVVDAPSLVLGKQQQQQTKQQKERGEEQGQGIAEQGVGNVCCVPFPTVGLKTDTKPETEETATTTMMTTPLLTPVSPLLADTGVECEAENASVDVFAPSSRWSLCVPCFHPPEDWAADNTWSGSERDAQKQEDEDHVDGDSKQEEEEEEEMVRWGRQREQQALTPPIPARSSRRAVVAATESTCPHLRSSETGGTLQEVYPSPEESPTGAYWRRGRDADATRLANTRQPELDVWRVSWQFCSPTSSL